mgnify:CR=1 FL=1
MSLRTILVIALLASTLLGHLPVQPVEATEKQDEVFFGYSWSIPDPLWTFSTPASLSQFGGAVSATITPDFCAGAYIGVGWPFQFTGQYPDSLPAGPNVGHKPVSIKLDNQVTQTGSSVGGCESSQNQNLIFEAFAGIKAKMNFDLTITAPTLPDFPEPPCELTWSNAWWCAPALTLYAPAKWAYDAAKSLCDGFVSVVTKALSFLPISLPIDYHDSVDLGDFLPGRPYMELAWGGNGYSPLSQTIGPLTGKIGPLPLQILPPIISDPGVMTVGLGAAVKVTPWVGLITGTPHVDDGGNGIVTTSSEGKSDTVVGDTSFLSGFQTVFDLRHKGIPPGNNPLPVTIEVRDLQQYVSIKTSIQPTITVHIIIWDIPVGLPFEIPLGEVSKNLPGNPGLVYQTEVASADIDLSLESVEQLPVPQYKKLTLDVVVKNKGTLAAAVAGYKSFEIREGANLLVRIVPYPEGGGLEANQYYTRQIEVPLDKLSSPLRGHHTLRIVVNPDKTVGETRYDNNEKTFIVKVLPDLVPSQISVYPTAPKVGDTVSITVVEWNTGLVDAPPEGYRSFAVYDVISVGSSSFGGLLAKTIYHVSQGAQPDLAQGKSWMGTVWTGKLSQYGSHQITVVVDPDDAVEEYQEDNNAITLTIDVKAPLLITTVTIPPQAKFDFSISARPSSQRVTRGGSATYVVVVTLLSGTAQPVTLSVTGLPSGASYSFSVNRRTPNPYFTSTLTVTTSARTSTGTYTLTIVATGGGVTHYTSVTLTVVR